MDKLETIMRDTVKHLLEEQKVDVVIGYKKGTVPLRTTPHFITKAADAQNLVWNACCDYNLTQYLLMPEYADKNVGIIVKGCDARALVVCMNEGQIAREKTTIIGMPCPGILDRKKIEAAVAPHEILEVKVMEDQILLKGKDFEKTLPRKEFIQASCKVCRYNNPPVCDILVGGKTIDLVQDDILSAELAELEKKSPDERWAYFTDHLKDCIRCYACRQACPLCYCKDCFVDQTQPQWVGKANDISNIMFYHMIRALHMAGRCVECGACSRACPMSIDLRLITRKLQKIVKERYNFEAGLDLETPPPMGTHTMEDPEEFITEPE
ncbi:MAG: 4Fe-4S dicluster domain-containing protein [Candidatus Helarchaeota archaeon]